tara:strand:- start:1059 stop:1298 length:240 start_codon:yes stop_codon:yes gene_type:complete
MDIGIAATAVLREVPDIEFTERNPDMEDESTSKGERTNMSSSSSSVCANENGVEANSVREAEVMFEITFLNFMAFEAEG